MLSMDSFYVVGFISLNPNAYLFVRWDGEHIHHIHVWTRSESFLGEACHAMKEVAQYPTINTTLSK